MSSNLENLKKDLRKLASPEKAKAMSRYFKTGKGEYAEGDKFLGLKTADTRSVVVKYWKELSFEDILKLLHSPIHEERSVAISILVRRFEKSDEEGRKKIYDLYLENAKYINNWDLVDMSAGTIVGMYLDDKDKSILSKLAKSDLIWERRIAMISTFYYIRQGNPEVSFKIAKLLLKDKHDLIHKAVGWMLREISKKSGNEIVIKFLKENYKELPRTTLRYAIERMPKKDKYLKGDFS